MEIFSGEKMKSKFFTSLVLFLLASCGSSENGVFLVQDDAASGELSEQDLASVVDGILENNTKLMAGIDSWEVVSIQIDDGGFGHVRLQQLVNEVPVFGGEAIVHIGGAK